MRFQPSRLFRPRPSSRHKQRPCKLLTLTPPASLLRKSECASCASRIGMWRSGSALVWGASGRWFKSSHPDIGPAVCRAAQSMQDKRPRIFCGDCGLAHCQDFNCIKPDVLPWHYFSRQCPFQGWRMLRPPAHWEKPRTRRLSRSGAVRVQRRPQGHHRLKRRSSPSNRDHQTGRSHPDDGCCQWESSHMPSWEWPRYVWNGLCIRVLLWAWWELTASKA